MSSAPRILLLDIETLPNLVTSWGLKVDGYLSHENIISERTILCAAWKWLGSPRVRSISTLDGKVKGRPVDYKIVKQLRAELAMADAVVTHNGDRFDLPWIRTRMIAMGFDPLPPVVSIDTKKIAKARFYFNSNRLDYLGKYLGVGKKIETTFGLWLECLKGDRKAMREMVRYNEQDVLLLERVFVKLRPFVPSKINHALWDDPKRTCPSCGEMALEGRGMSVSRTGRQHRYQCRSCGAWSQRPITASDAAVVR